jgi:hypothetical protein
MEEFLEVVFSVWSMPRLYNKDQQDVISWKSEVGVGGYQSTVLSCTVRRPYKAMTSENREDLVFAVVIRSVCESVKLL